MAPTDTWHVPRGRDPEIFARTHLRSAERSYAALMAGGGYELARNNKPKAGKLFAKAAELAYREDLPRQKQMDAAQAAYDIFIDLNRTESAETLKKVYNLP